MARTSFQRGADRSHWHDALGIDYGVTGEQRIRLLGPFTWSWDDDGFEGSGAEVFDIEANQVVISAWCIVRIPFNAETFPNPAVILGMGPTVLRAFKTDTTSNSIGDRRMSALLAGLEVGTIAEERDMPAYFGGTDTIPSPCIPRSSATTCRFCTSPRRFPRTCRRTSGRTGSSCTSRR